jgi:hypothetical protein
LRIAEAKQTAIQRRLANLAKMKMGQKMQPKKKEPEKKSSLEYLDELLEE